MSVPPVGHPTRPFPRCVFLSDRTCDQDSARGTVSQPSSNEDARWNAERQAVEFGVEIGEYRGVVQVPRRVFQRLWRSGHPQAVVEAHYLQRPRFESIAERKLRRQQLTEDRNVEIGGRDFREAPAQLRDATMISFDLRSGRAGGM
jgi:hypothetical protein